jgi:hypothetical protein
MLRCPPEATGYSQAHERHSYPKTRTGFLPPAYVLLTREMVPGMEERHGYTWQARSTRLRRTTAAPSVCEALTEAANWP